MPLKPILYLVYQTTSLSYINTPIILIFTSKPKIVYQFKKFVYSKGKVYDFNFKGFSKNTLLNDDSSSICPIK